MTDAKGETLRMLDTLDQAMVEFQVTLVDRLSPSLRQTAYRLGRFYLAWRSTMPWYRRWWQDIRSGASARQIVDGLASLVPGSQRSRQR